MQNHMNYQCKSHYDACSILGIDYRAGRDVWKSAYREICRKFHPDVLTEAYVEKCGYTPEQLEQIGSYFKMATTAYEFLEREAGTAAPAMGKVIGGRTGYSSDHASYQRSQEEFRKKKQKERLEKQEELKKAAQEISRKQRVDEILEEIRWIRISEIIHNTIMQDKMKEQLKEEIAKKQGN